MERCLLCGCVLGYDWFGLVCTGWFGVWGLVLIVGVDWVFEVNGFWLLFLFDLTGLVCFELV